MHCITFPPCLRLEKPLLSVENFMSQSTILSSECETKSLQLFTYSSHDQTRFSVQEEWEYMKLPLKC